LEINAEELLKVENDESEKEWKNHI
jgi:hypothetical protein